MLQLILNPQKHGNTLCFKTSMNYIKPLFKIALLPVFWVSFTAYIWWLLNDFSFSAARCTVACYLQWSQSPINLLMNWYWLYFLWAGNVSEVIVTSFSKWTSMNFPYCRKCRNQLKKSNWFNATWFQIMLMAPDQKLLHPSGLESEWLHLCVCCTWSYGK